MTLQQILVISVKGKPFDRGRQYGSQAREQICRNVYLYFDMWNTLCGAKRSEVLKQCTGLVPVIGEYDADILEELEGVAKGADLSLEEIIALNARYDITSTLSIAHQYMSSGCTSVAALPQVTKDGHTILGQNWDFKPRFQESNITLEVEQEGKPNIVTQTEAGTLAHRGMNSAGLGVCFNALASSQDRFESATPFLIMIRGILKPLYPDTLFRCHRAQQLLELDKGHIDVASFQHVFQDHFSYPHSICRHADARDEGLKQWPPLFSMIMDLEARTIYIAEGAPCQNDYYQLTTQSLRKD